MGGGFGYKHILLSTFTKYISLCENPIFSLLNWILFLEIIEFPMTENTIPMTDFQHKIICKRSS